MNKKDRLFIKNGNVFMPDGKFIRANISIVNGIIDEIIPFSLSDDCYVNCIDSDNMIDASGLYVTPGFLDIHTHGADGYDFSSGDEEGLLRYAAYEKTNGITSFCPTSMSFNKDMLEKIFRNAASLAKAQQDGNYLCESDTAFVVGVNMEGPFICTDRAGAQDRDNILAPGIDMFKELNKSCDGLIKLVTIAPEIEGADIFIETFSSEVNISLGHTNADYETALNALKKGANHITHLFNAMPGLGHREPGVIGAASDSKNTYVELICDGIHVHPGAVRAAFKLFGDERLVFISDSTEATGMPDGEYELGGQKVYKKGKRATLADGTIAGSASNLYECFAKAVEFGIPLGSALKCVTVNPAKSIGMEDRIGVIKKGARADLLLIDEELKLTEVI